MPRVVSRGCSIYWWILVEGFVFENLSFKMNPIPVNWSWSARKGGRLYTKSYFSFSFGLGMLDRFFTEQLDNSWLSMDMGASLFENPFDIFLTIIDNLQPCLLFSKSIFPLPFTFLFSCRCNLKGFQSRDSLNICVYRWIPCILLDSIRGLFLSLVTIDSKS